MEILNHFQNPVFQYFLLACNGFAIFVWLLTLVTQNISHMDRVWGVLPNLYAAGFLFCAFHFNSLEKSEDRHSILKSDLSSQSRLILMATLLAIWGIRICYVFYRRGYYSSKYEDHRWELVKKKYGYPEKKLAYHLFNFFFMGFLQNWILFGHSLPFWFILTNTASNRITSQQPLNILDLVMAALFVFFLAFEIIGDEQQWRFQCRKKEWTASGENQSGFSEEEIKDFKRGFICNGLFKYSRHPNYFGEMFLWWVIYGFTISSQYSVLKESFEFGLLINYSAFSMIIMTILFPRSSAITEKISGSKYPEYADYKSKVPQIIPSFRAYVPKSQ